MADSAKRNSIGATPIPKSESPGPASEGIEALAQAIGARIRITTIAPHNQTYEGSLYTADPILNIVALNTRPSTHPSGDYHIVPFSKIEHFRILSLENGGSQQQQSQHILRPVDTKALQARLDKRVAQAKEDLVHKNANATPEGQAIYDAFKRINQPVRWHQDQIIVHDAVIIQPPYNIEDCKAARDKTELLGRVKRMLEGERRKLAEKAKSAAATSGSNAAASSTGPRKGG